MVYYIKQIYSMFPNVCSAEDHRRRQNVITTWNLSVKVAATLTDRFHVGEVWEVFNFASFSG